jgi:hypothetical protein
VCKHTEQEAMARNRESMETVHLTIELLHRIPRDSKITAPELQRQLVAAGYERDLRSIQRHLKQITEHFDVVCDDRGKPYGYRWKAKAKGLSLPGMNQHESLLLTLDVDEEIFQQISNALYNKLWLNSYQANT